MSECFQIYDRNLVDQSTLVGVTANAMFPVDNIKDPRRSKVFRTVSNSGRITMDFQEASEIDTIFIVADKRNGFGFSQATFLFNMTDYWVSPAYSVVVPISIEAGIGHIEIPKINYRFARVLFTTTLDYVEVSTIYIGKKLELERGINFGWSIKDDELSTKQTNRYGQIFADVISRQKKITCTVSNAPKEDMTKMFKLFDRVGETKPLFIKLGANNMIDDYRRFSGMVFLDDIPSVVNSFFSKYSFTMTFKEAT